MLYQLTSDLHFIRGRNLFYFRKTNLNSMNCRKTCAILYPCLLHCLFFLICNKYKFTFFLSLKIKIRNTAAFQTSRWTYAPETVFVQQGRKKAVIHKPCSLSMIVCVRAANSQLRECFTRLCTKQFVKQIQNLYGCQLKLNGNFKLNFSTGGINSSRKLFVCSLEYKMNTYNGPFLIWWTIHFCAIDCSWLQNCSKFYPNSCIWPWFRLKY